MQDFLYWAMISCFFTHELDAVKRHEWRVLPVLRALPEKSGEQAFIWLHVPLFFFILHSTFADPTGAIAKGLSAFAVLHVGLHWLFRKHPAYEFNNASSWSLIVLIGVLGAAHLVITW